MEHPLRSMRILFTGASSFSGMWFVQELSHAGHQVVATFRGNLESYEGIKKERIEQALPFCTPAFEMAFGDKKFLELIDSQAWDLLCHHAADVTNYKSPDFDPGSALVKNTYNLKCTLTKLQEKGCCKVLLTGSLFEQREGVGPDNWRAFSPYGLSKGLTFDTFAFYTTLMGIKLGKFVIPNPFGPYEEEKFTTYLAKTWMKKEIGCVKTPLYVRDNVPVELLAKAYARFAERLSETPGIEKLNPSCYVESQGDFTTRFAREMRLRLNRECLFELKPHLCFDEPMERINTDRLDWSILEKEESRLWDRLADYYLKIR